MRKRILLVLLSLIVTISMIPLAASADDSIISSVKVSYVEPAPGTLMKLPTVPKDANYVISAFTVSASAPSYFADYDMGHISCANCYFKRDYQYYYRISLEPKEGYVFDESKFGETGFSVDYLDAPDIYPSEANLTHDKLYFETASYIGCYTLNIPKKTYVYTGSAIKPEAALKDADDNLTYTVSYKNNKAVGTATVSAAASGEDAAYYAGTPKTTFKIIPKKAAVKSLTSGIKKLTVKMSTKVSSTGGTKYKIAYRVKGTSSWKYTTTTLQSKTIKNLKKGKNYQVKVKAYKGSYEGSWSAVKTSKKIK